MNGVDGHSMTNIEDGGEGGGDGTQDPADQKNNGAQPDATGAAGANGRGENPEAAGRGGPDEDPAGGEGEGAEAEPELDENGDPIVAADGDGAGEEAATPLTPELISQMVAKSVEDAMLKNKPADAPPQLTEEQWAAKEQEVGVERKAIQFFTAQSMKVWNAVQDAMDARFAKFEKIEAIRDLSRTKGFEDASRYQKGIDSFLTKYQPKYHSNPELLKMAVIYARGLARSGDVRRAQVSSQRNVRVAGAARPSSPGSSAGATRRPGSTQRPLTASQREVMQKFGWTEKEYRDSLSTRGTPVTDGVVTRR